MLWYIWNLIIRKTTQSLNWPTFETTLCQAVRAVGTSARTQWKERHPCVVENCGELQPGSDWGLAENDGTPDKYPPFPEDWELSTKLKVRHSCFTVF
uniref:Uncharacterized protein n=1 Tax=Timema cristinae TaxID=61476 RepID=A0A7R9D5C8_TIMCR|nr:unnamed protein product [Timema cristinae]